MLVDWASLYDDPLHRILLHLRWSYIYSPGKKVLPLQTRMLLVKENPTNVSQDKGAGGHASFCIDG